MKRDAILSQCGQYRYLLTRTTDTLLPANGQHAVFVMLNPSTADATEDDPTIRRCLGFARSWGCSGLTVANLYALRSTDPAALRDHVDPVGPENDMHLRKLALQWGEVVCAWGTNADPTRVAEVVRMLKRCNIRMLCLGTNKDGSPKHPLYVRADQPLIPWVA